MRVTRRAVVGASLCAMLCVLGGCRAKAALETTDAGATMPASSGFPVAVKDDLGRSVTVAAMPRRIVCLLPSHTEVLFAVGAGDRVVGIDDNSDYPPEVARVPRLGALYDPHLEQILALAPDLVIMSEDGAAPDRLASLGLTVWAGKPKRLEDVYRLAELVGRLVGRADAARELVVRMHAEVAAVEAKLARVPRVRVYEELDPTPYTVGPESFLGALLDKAGADNIIPAGLGEFPRISPELVIARDPEVILGVSLTDASKRPGWSAITAIKTGRVDVLSQAEQNLITRPGPRIAQGIEALARHLHGALVEGAP